jgi:exonuclease III
MDVSSIKLKFAIFIEYVRDSDADLIALTETWLTVDDTAASLEIVPNGYKLINHPRVKCKGGRIALLHTDNFSVMNIKRVEESSFEISEQSIKFEYLSFTIFDQPFSHG